MKKIKKIPVILLGIMLLITSCNDFFDKEAIGKADIGSYWQTEFDIKSWVAGTYSGVQQVIGNNLLIWGESRSDNFHPTIYGGDKWQLNALLSTDAPCNWESLYTVIARCNGGLEKIDNVENVTETNMNIYKGQFYAIRAWMYFYAIRVWGDVPLILKTWDGNEKTKYHVRTPIVNIKTQIQKDIDLAVELLQADITPTTSAAAPNNANCFYFNKGAALALKMDIHLWFNEYVQAIESSDFIMKLGIYSLVTNANDWKNIFLSPYTSTETIFTLNWVYPDNDSNPYGSWVANHSQSPKFCVSKEAFNLMLKGNKKDIRFWGVIDTLKIYNEIGRVPIDESAIVYGRYTRGDQINKFFAMKSTGYGFVTLGKDECDIKLPIYRYADVLLMRAEALNKRNAPGDAEKVIDIINQIRHRCGNSEEVSAAYYIEQSGYGEKSRERLILEERQVEFYGEGKRWFDLRRSEEIFYTVMNQHLEGLQNYYGNPVIGFPKDGREFFPLHQSVFTANPLLVGHQNPPYSE